MSPNVLDFTIFTAVYYISSLQMDEQLQTMLLRTLLKVCYKEMCRFLHLDRVKRIWYLSPMRAAKAQASLRIRAVSPEPSLLAHTSESRETFRQKARSLIPLNGWACAVKICHDGMLEDTNSLDGAHFMLIGCIFLARLCIYKDKLMLYPSIVV